MAFIITILFAIYIVGILIYVGMRTTTDAKYHDGGFLGAGYITTTARKATSKDARISLLWPILLILWFIKIPLWMLNESISFISLLLGISYETTKTYEYLEAKLWPL